MEYSNNKTIEIKFTPPRYDNEIITSPFNVTDISKSLDKLEKKIKKTIQGLSDDEYYEIETLVCTGIKKAVKEKEDTEEQKKRKEATVNKYSQNRKGNLYESILVEGEPFFISINNDNSDGVEAVSSIEEKTRILKPPALEEYLHNPYEFLSSEELEHFITKAKKETIFSLYEKAKSIISKYIDQEEYVINLVTIDVIFSYFQDRFNTVHYTGIFGDNGTGKSSIGDIVEALAYRAMNTTDPTPANIFRSLGSVEAGQITLILDEAEKVDQSSDMKSILKTGYDFKKQVSRINQFTGKPEKFYAYCHKLIIGERPPSQSIARGVMDRTFAVTMYVGKPKYDIKEILNPTDTGGKEYKELLDEILDFRKTLFFYRLIHFKDTIENIDIGISGRNKELVKPYLQLVSNIKTDEDNKIYQEIEKTFQTLLKIKNNKKDFTLEAAIIPIIIDLMEESKAKTVTFSMFWDKLQYYINGRLDEKKPNEYHTEDFGTIYRNSVSNILQKLGVDSKHHSRYTELIFDNKKIMKNACQYNISIQTKLDADAHCERSEDSIGDIIQNEQILGADSRYGHGEPIISDKKIEEGTTHNGRTNSSTNEPFKEKERGELSIEHAQHAPAHLSYSDQIHKNIYRYGKSDTWGCKNCKQNGDRWYMEQHQCRGLKNYDRILSK